VTVLVVLAVPGAAGADSAEEARARADEAAARVAALQAEVSDARADYRRTLRTLAGAVTREVQADEAADTAARAALVAAQRRVAAVRALEQSGGSLGMVEGVLDAGSPAEFAARWKLSSEVVTLLAGQADVLGEAAAATSSVAAREQSGSRVALATVDDVEQAYVRLDALLSEQEEILAALDAEARELAQAERIQARIEAERAAAAAAASSASGTATAGGIPRDYLELYQAAASTCQGLPWPVLAAIGQVESGHGTNTGPSSAGAMGPMQFLPSTFAAYAVDGDGDGVADIWNPADAIYSAARYLCANGAGGGPRALYNALYRYNPADWYVQLVMGVASQLAQRFGEPVPVAERP
jgi:membrane-bound lytic murein transglycosylase B